MREVLACGQTLLRSFDMLLKLHRATRRFDNSISAGMTSAGIEAGAAVKIDAAASRGEFAVDSEIDAAGSIAQDGVNDSVDAFGRRTRQTNPLRDLKMRRTNPIRWQDAADRAERSHRKTRNAPNEPNSPGIKQPIAPDEASSRPENAPNEPNFPGSGS